MRTSLVCILRVSCLLLAASVAFGQGLEQRVDQVLRAETAPRQRLDLIKALVAEENGAAELVRRGLVATQTGEVTHAIAEALISADRHLDHLAPLSRLLLDDKHRGRIGRRIAAAGELPSSRRRLVERLAALAEGTDAAASGKVEMRRAGIRALAVIAWRPALEALVQAWGKDASGPLADDFRAAVLPVLGVDDARSAARVLADRPFATYADLLRELNRDLIAKLAKANRYRELALRQADAETAFRELKNGSDRLASRIAASRIQELAAQKKWGQLGAEGFSKNVFEVYIDQRGRAESDATVLKSILGALTELWRGNGKSPLRKVTNAKTLVASVLPLADRGAPMKDVGRASVALLGEVGEAGAEALVEFARRFDDDEVRRAAIQNLGRLAATSEQRRDFIRRSLVDMLAGGDVSAAVRSELLFTLARSVGAVALDRLPVAGWLQKPESAPKLDVRDLRHCVMLITNSGGADALEALLQISTSHPSEDVRLLAATEGLLRWMKRDAKEAPRLRAHLQALALAQTQPEALRVKLIAALGALGARDMNETLAAIGATKEAPDTVRAAAMEARFALAQRLTTVAGGTVAREDLAVALQILDALPDPKQRERLAEKIVFAADGAKLPAGRARYLLAQLKSASADEKTVTRLLQEAALRAEADGLDTESRQALHGDLRARALKGERFKEAVEHSVALAKLATDPLSIAQYYTEAAEYALRGGDKNRARALVKLAGAEGKPDAALGQRLKAVTDQAGDG